MNSNKVVVGIFFLAFIVASSAVSSLVYADEYSESKKELPTRAKITLEEVLVTAQKRTEDVRDVPIAISVVSGEQLAKSGINDFNGLAAFLPNVSINTDFNTFYMRGIGTSELNVIAEQATSYIVDGVYLAKVEFLKPGFLDVERIEVLKGPQGTLFGRNATAGVINITTGIPSDELAAKISLKSGSRDQKEIEGVLSLPLTDSLRFRFSGKTREQAGHSYNGDTGRTIGDKEAEKYRLKLQYDFSDNAAVSLGYTAFNHSTGSWAGTEVSVLPSEYELLIRPFDADFESNVDRRGHSNRQNHSYGDGYILPLQFDYERWGHNFTSITAIAGLEDHVGGDLDGSALPIIDLFADVEYKQFTQEFRLTSPPGTLEYVLGLYYLDSHVDATIDIPLFSDLDSSAVLGLLENTIGLGSVLSSIGLGGVLSSLESTLNTFLGSPLEGSANGVFSVITKSSAVFGQASWHISDTLTLLFGARYTDDEGKGSGDVTTDGPVTTILFANGYSQKNRVLAFTDFSPKLSLTWELHDNVTAYATYAKGFRAGSFNIVSLRSDTFEFAPEFSDTYEYGMKTEFLDGAMRFNMGGFLTKYDGYQLAVFNGFTSVGTNAEEVEIKGIETDLTAMVYPGLMVNINAGYIDGKFIKNTNGACTAGAVVSDLAIPTSVGALGTPESCDLSGRDLHRAPNLTGSARVDYVAQLFDWPIEFTIGADATFKDDELMDADLDPDDFQEAYWLYNARIGLMGIDGGWSVVFNANNLEDKTVKTYSGDVPLLPGAHFVMVNPPRSYSLSLRFEY